MAVNLDAVLLSLIIRIVVLSPILWISARLLVSGDKARFTDAIWIVVLGTIIGGLFEYFFIGWISVFVVLFVWLALVKHFFDCGWLKALAISIVAILIFSAIAVILGIMGFAVWSTLTV